MYGYVSEFAAFGCDTQAPGFGYDHIDAHIMGFGVDFVDYLEVIPYTHFHSLGIREQAVIKTFAATDTVTTDIISHSRHYYHLNGR